MPHCVRKTEGIYNLIALVSPCLQSLLMSFECINSKISHLFKKHLDSHTSLLHLSLMMKRGYV